MRLNQSVLYISLRHIWTPKKRTCKNVHVKRNVQVAVSQKIVKNKAGAKNGSRKIKVSGKAIF